MRSCKGGKNHQYKVVMDPDVKGECGMQSVWTPEGNRDLWLCGHHLTCERCRRVVSKVVKCPENKALHLQDRRWR